MFVKYHYFFIFLTQPKTDPNSNITNQVWSTCFNNDGSILIACVGDAILVYDALQGELVNKAMRGGNFFV